MNIILEILICAVVGSVLHFTYDWSGRRKWVGVFSAVNESVWEHVKIGLTPMILCSVVDGFLQGWTANFWVSRAVLFLVFILMIPSLFYGYQVFTKRTVLVVDIISFYAAIVTAEVFAAIVMAGAAWSGVWLWGAYAVIAAVLVAYGKWTFWPPRNELFYCPMYKGYGVDAKAKAPRGHHHHHHGAHKHQH